MMSETYGVPMAYIYSDLDKIETEDYILSKKSYRYPENVFDLIHGGMCPGDYVVLYSKKRHCVVMSDTPMERYTNRSILQNAQGDVCLLGLGIGMVIFALIEEQAYRRYEIMSDYTEDDNGRKPIRSITVIEKDKALIKMIEPMIRNNRIFKSCNIKLEIINGDAYEWPKTNSDRHFDLVYADIWDEYHGYEDESSVFDEVEELWSPLCDQFDGWGYRDAHGDNPDDESPTERDDYGHYMAKMLKRYREDDLIEEELWNNILEYAEA